MKMGHASAAVETLRRAGYTYEGGDLWKPPLGPEPGPLLDRIAELETALLSIAALNDLSGYADQTGAAYGHLAECERIARNALGQ